MSTLKYRDSNNDYQGFYVKVTDTLPVGSVYLWGSITAPSGYLICDGRAVSRTEYADLFKAIGTNFGSGDGLTTFNIPDYRGRVPVGLDGSDADFDTIGKKLGSKYLQQHTHNYLRHHFWSGERTDHPAILGNSNVVEGKGILVPSDGANTTTGDSGNIQPSLVTNYIIKASNKVALERGNVVDSLTGDDTDSAPSVRAVKEAFQTKGQVLWTNPNPTSQFDSQSITLSSNDYDYLDIIYKNYVDSDTFEVQRVFKDYIPSEIGGTFYYNNNIYTGTRKVTSANNGLQIGFGYAQGIQIGQATLGADLKWIVPQKIIGYKN